MRIFKRIVIIIAVLALAGWIAYKANLTYQAKKLAMNRPAPEKIVPVESARPFKTDITEKIHASANIQAESEVTLYSKVNGKIAQNLVKMGSAVQPGQVVAIVNRDEVGYDFKPFEVKSDAKGVVSKLFLNPGAAVNPSVPILTLVDIDTVKAVAAVDEKKIRFIRMGEPARLSLEAYPGEMFVARVTNISPVANATNRTIEVELGIPNADHRIKPGMYAEVEWIESKRTSLVVPLSAVVDRAGGKCVFLIDNGLAKMNPVSTGAVVGDTIEILTGLKGDEPVVSTGAALLNDKDKIKVVERKTAQE